MWFNIDTAILWGFVYLIRLSHYEHTDNLESDLMDTASVFGKKGEITRNISHYELNNITSMRKQLGRRSVCSAILAK